MKKAKEEREKPSVATCTYYFIRRDTKVFINFTSYSAFLRHSKKKVSLENATSISILYTRTHTILFSMGAFSKRKY